MRALWIGAAIVAMALAWLILREGQAPETNQDADPTSLALPEPASGRRGPQLTGSQPDVHGTRQAETRKSPSAEPDVIDPFDPGPGVVRGVVYGPDKQPLAGLTVQMTGLRVPRTARSDAMGRFRFEKVPANWSPRVWVAEQGWVPKGPKFGVSPHIKAGRTHDVELHLVKALTAHGTVRRFDGPVVAGARVWVIAEHTYAMPVSFADRLVTTSDADGSFRIEGLPRSVAPTSLSVHAIADGLPEVSAKLATTRVFADEVARKATDPLELVLGEPCFADVLVVDEDTGEGIPQAVVGGGRHGSRVLGTTDEEGHVRVGPVAPGEHAWKVRAEGWGTLFEAEAVRVRTRPGVVVRARHKMYRTYTISGRIVYEDGTLADDRRYGLILKQDDSFRLGTDVSGRFRVSDLRGGTYEILISKQSIHHHMESENEADVLGRDVVEAGAKDVVISLEGRPPATLEVRARDGMRNPLEPGVLVAKTDDDVWNIDNYAPRRLEQGVAHIRGLKGPVWIEVVPAPGTPWARKRIGPIAPGTGHVTVDLEPGHEMTGIVVDPDGQPAEGIEVRAYPEVPEKEYERFGWHHTHGDVVTKADGRFTFDRLWTGRYRLRVMVSKQYAPLDPVHVDAGARDLVIRLTRRIDLDLPILDADGQPQAGARVTVWTPPWFGDSSGLHATADDDGIAHLRGLDPRPGQCLEVKPPRGVEASRRLWLEGWTPTDDPVRLPGAWVLSGQVIDEAGDPVLAARVHLEPRDGRPVSATGTDKDGQFRFVQLPFEPVRLTAYGPRGRSTAQIAEVAPGTKTITLGLTRHEGRLRVRIANWPSSAPARPGQASARFAVWCPDAPWLRRTGQPSQDGLVTVDGLDPERTWSLAVVRDDVDLQVCATDLKADSQEVAVRAAPGQPLRGRVLSSSSTWPIDVVVLEIGRYARVQDDGTYEISGLPPGRWTLRASASRARDRVYRTVVATESTAPDIDFAR